MSSPWTTVALSEIATIRKGKKPGSMVSESVAAKPYLTADVLRGGDCIQFVPNAEASNCVELKGTEVVVLWDGAGAGDVFPSREGILASTMASVEVIKPDLLLPKFLQYVVAGQTHILKSTCRGTTVPHVAPEVLQQLEIPVPPRRIQERIVDVMASVDTYIAGLEKQVAAARTARNAVLHDLISSLSIDSPQVKLGDVLDISRGGSPRPIDAFITDDDDGINWVKIGDATASSKYIYETKQKIRPDGARRSREVSPGDFLLSNSMSFGRPYIMRTTGCIHDGWLLLSGVSSHFDEDYLYNVLLSQDVQMQFESLAAGSGVRNLNIGVVNSVTVPLPSRDEQKAVAEIANEIDSFVLNSEETLAVVATARAAMVESLLSGVHQIPDSYDKFLGAA
jgi:type I restriction enzyme S subunit